MNEDTKKGLQLSGLLLVCAIIGGFIGGMMSNCCCCCCCHHKGPMPPMGGFHHGKQIPPQHMNQKGPGFEGKFIEEDYIIIPDNEFGKGPKKPEGQPERMAPQGKKPKHFDGPIPKKD